MDQNTLTVVSALISAAVTLAVCLINNHMQMRKNDQEQDNRMMEISHQQEIVTTQLQGSMQENLAIITTTLENLTNEVREHNNFARRMPVMEEKVSNIETRLSKLEANSNKRRRLFG